MARLAISLFGPFQAHLDGRPLRAFKSQKVRALLAYLAAESHQPHARAVLADLLWPDRRDQEALRRMSDALFDLRRVLGDRRANPPFLQVARDALQLHPHSPHSVDAREFMACTQRDHSPLPEDLQRAVALYRGPFLDGFSVDSAPYEEWVLRRRAEYARAALAALQGLAEHHEARGEWAEVARWARRQVELEPWDEGAHRRLMRALALGGQRGAALAQYEACRKALAEGLGVDPEPQTQALHRELLEGSPVAEAPAVVRLDPLVAVAPPPRMAERRGTFVGRERELAWLQAHLEGAIAGQGQAVFVAGEPGSGKTWLAQEFARRAVVTDPNLVVAVGQAHAYAGIGDPYLPFIHVLRALTGDLSDQWPQGVLPAHHASRLQALLRRAAEALAGEGRELLGRLVSGEALLERLGTQGRYQTLVPRLREAIARAEQGGTVEQSHLFERYALLLATLSHSAPLLLVLEDLQWADTGTLSLLFHLGRGLPGRRILIVGTYRTGVELADGRQGEAHPLAALTEELARTRGELPLDLDRADGHAFVEALLHAEPNRLDATFRRTLLRHTGGHPLFTVELWRGLRERGAVWRDQGGCWVAGGDLDWGHLPPRVESLIGARIDLLSREHRALLEVASVEGEAFTAEVLARAMDLELGAVLGLLGTPPLRGRLVEDEGVQRVAGRRLSRYRFRHELFRAYLYGTLDAGRRAYLHEVVGRALEALYGERAGEVAAALGHHYSQAGLAVEAARHLLEAAHRASYASIVVEACALCRQGLALLESEPETPEAVELQVRLLMLLSVLLMRLTDIGAAELGEAMAQAESLCRRHGLDRWLSRVLATRACTMPPAQGQVLAEEAVQLAERTGAPEHLAYAYCRRGMVLFVLGKLSAAWQHYERGLQHYASLPKEGRHDSAMPPRELAARSLAEASMVQAGLGHLDRAASACEEAVARAEEIGSEHTANYVHHHAKWVHLIRDDWKEILRHVAVAAENELQEDKPPRLAPAIRLVRTCAAVAAGRATPALLDEILTTYEAFCQTGVTDWYTGALRMMVADALIAGGRPRAGLGLVDQWLAIARRTGACCLDAEFLRLRGEALLRGDEDEAAAEACFRQSLAVARSQEAKSIEVRAATSLARLWQAQGRGQEALALLAPVYGWFTEGLDTAPLSGARALLDDLGYTPS